MAMRIGSCGPCVVWATGFLSGVCIVYLFGVLLLPPGFTQSPPSTFQIPAPAVADPDGAASTKELTPLVQEKMERPNKNVRITEARITHLFNAWSALLNTTTSDDALKRPDVPRPPHLENCRLNVEKNMKFDSRGDDGAFPPWTLWKGSLGLELFNQNLHAKKGAPNPDGLQYPPWIAGSDEENYPQTRRVQRDIWVHQHPPDCSDPNLRFMVADWERLPRLGIGAHIVAMSGLLSIAMKEKRILIMGYYNRADHDGCKGASRSSWSCYFFPETSPDCHKRAFELVQNNASLANGTVRVKNSYDSRKMWVAGVPRLWGEPWKHMQPTTEVNGTLIRHHRRKDARWWVAQAGMARTDSDDIERLVWSDHRPYLPRPLLSVHIRMGDKACEMAVVGFDKYMELAGRLRRRFPSLKNIWLSTEMQEVIDGTGHYPGWSFYFTRAARQSGNQSMAAYETSLGREASTNNALVNFMMATEADFFVGALGSTWCYIIDGMRNTGGKVMAGFLSVNKDRFW
ncbi:unnamed protein product [Urochloa decumbens]|uniref:Uncharacterized protein n=1 Tax=Urochloa decumbens TaxID=240449 RepID=A0ABC9E8V3_9POAL